MHLVQFYDDDSFLLDTTAQFIGGSLAQGNAAISIGTDDHLEGLALRLLDRGIDLQAVRSAGRYVSRNACDALATFMVDGWPDNTLFTREIGGLVDSVRARCERPRIAVFGEMVSVLWAQGMQEAAIELEKIWNDLGRTHAFSLRCAYRLNQFASGDQAEALQRVCGEHSHVIPPDNFSAGAENEESIRKVLRQHEFRMRNSGDSIQAA